MAKKGEKRKDLPMRKKNYLPQDMVEIILQRLPVKSLLRFKVVSRSWNAIISDYEFTKSHLHLQQLKIKDSSSSEANIFVSKPSSVVDRDYRLVKFKNNKFQVETIHKEPDAGIYILCFADGLALFRCLKSYLLWNPRTKQERIISPCPHQDFGVGRDAKTFGFFRGPALDDYKIVALYSDCYNVYSCKNRLWSEKKKFPFSLNPPSYILKGGGLFVDGFSFWVILNFSNYEILYFDPRHETFNKLQMPEKITKENKIFDLVSLSGSLCLYYRDCRSDEQHLRIWKLRDNNVDDSSSSWSEFMNIRVDVYNPIENIHFRPLFLVGKNKIVIGKGPWEKEPVYSIYDSKENKCEKLESSLPIFESRPSITIRYLDTLFFPA